MISFSEFAKDKIEIPSVEKVLEEMAAKEENAVNETQYVPTPAPIPQPIKEAAKPVDEGYLLYRDKAENFSCDISIEGAKLNQSEARIVVESEEWTLVFPGKIIGNKCLVPLKKLSLFEEGCKGKIKLEVIAEDTLFVPWEENFTVKTSKKVMVNLLERENSNVSEDKTKVKIQNIR